MGIEIHFHLIFLLPFSHLAVLAICMALKWCLNVGRRLEHVHGSNVVMATLKKRDPAFRDLQTGKFTQKHRTKVGSCAYYKLWMKIAFYPFILCSEFDSVILLIFYKDFLHKYSSILMQPEIDSGHGQVCSLDMYIRLLDKSSVIIMAVSPIAK